MAGTRKPTAVLKAGGKHHGTKAEYAEREAKEVHAQCDNIIAPAYLRKAQKNRFNQLVEELQRCDKKLVTNLDTEALARLVVIEDDFKKVTKELRKQKIVFENKVVVNGELKVIETINENYDKLQLIRQRLWNQCRQGAADFGLTISSRCRLVAPNPGEEKKENKFIAKFTK